MCSGLPRLSLAASPGRFTIFPFLIFLLPSKWGSFGETNARATLGPFRARHRPRWMAGPALAACRIRRLELSILYLKGEEFWYRRPTAGYIALSQTSAVFGSDIFLPRLPDHVARWRVTDLPIPHDLNGVRNRGFLVYPSPHSPHFLDFP